MRERRKKARRMFLEPCDTGPTVCRVEMEQTLQSQSMPFQARGNIGGWPSFSPYHNIAEGTCAGWKEVGKR